MFYKLVIKKFQRLNLHITYIQNVWYKFWIIYRHYRNKKNVKLSTVSLQANSDSTLFTVQR